jgi:putative ABC transport system substrate-binding protein
VSSADGNAGRLPELATELVRLPVDVIVATFTPCALAAKHATTTIPIVMAAVADPVGSGLVQSLALPGGNITGFSNMAAETAGKSVELFRDLLPSLRRVAVLANPVDTFTRPFLEQVRLAGRTAAIEIAPVVMARAPDEVEPPSLRWHGRARKPSSFKASSFRGLSPIWRSRTDCHRPQYCGSSRKRAV